MTFCAAITYIFLLVAGSCGKETIIIIISKRQLRTDRVSNNNLESALPDVVRVQIGREFPVIDDSMRDVEYGPVGVLNKRKSSE